MISYKVIKCISLVIVFSIAVQIGFSSFKRTNNHTWADSCKTSVTKDAVVFANSLNQLKAAINQIKPKDTNSVIIAKQALIECRLDYKKIEYYMEQFVAFPVNIYNPAPIYEVEEPFMEYQAPIGMQVIEADLFEPEPYEKLQELLEQTNTLYTSANDIKAVLFSKLPEDMEVGYAINNEIIRIATLGITGYDAPILKTGTQEAIVSLKSIQNVYNEGLRLNTISEIHSDSIQYLFSRGLELLSAAPSFNKFDRLSFLTNSILPLQHYLNIALCESFPNINDTTLYNYKAKHFFAPDALKKNHFDTLAQFDTNTALVNIGKKLFSDPLLSGNNQVSCKSCHNPALYFSDGLKGSVTFDKKSITPRNAPTLLYAVYQYRQFWDGRDSSFTNQVYSVLQNPNEMHSNLNDVADKLNANAQYVQLFKDYFTSQETAPFKIKIQMVANALAAYERTLTPFNAPFDKYISGDKSAMTVKEINGFNLFMGKAQCGTCHFAPIFNGALPPLYYRTENEILGIPALGKLKHDHLDKDLGKANFFPIEFYRYSFKTPTVRNAAKTMPYMHNGSFNNLTTLIEFYNLGGGNGIGLDVPGQTLSDRKLNLSKSEIQDLKSFLLALTDKIE